MALTTPDRTRGWLPGDACGDDWILHRDLECASLADLARADEVTWAGHLEGLLQRSDFYREKFRGVIGSTLPSLADLPSLPFTTKAELRDSQAAHPPFGTYLGVPVDRVKRVYQTSGTTGLPNMIALTHADLSDVWGVVQQRAYYAAGVHRHSRVLTTFGAGPFVAGSTLGALERLGACLIPIAPGDTARVLAAFERGLADALQGTASFALHLATLLDSRGIDGTRYGIRNVLTGGEPGGGVPSIRERIEATFGAVVCEVYGLADVTPSLFAECPAGGGLHYCGQGLATFELVDVDGDSSVPIEPGAMGEAVYTALQREAMPLVRYRSGDIFSIQDGDCGCGRTSVRMRCVGRTDDMFIVRGVNVYPTALQDVVGDFRPRVTGRIRVVLPHGQVSVEPPVPIEVEVPAGSTGDDGLAAEIATALRARLVLRSEIRLTAQAEFGDAGYKTNLVRRVPA